MDLDTIRVQVHRSWDSWHNAEVRLRDIDDLHWVRPTGAPHELLHGFITCGDIVAGAIPHDGCTGGGMHRLCVCILKRHTVASAYEALSARADMARARNFQTRHAFSDTARAVDTSRAAGTARTTAARRAG